MERAAQARVPRGLWLRGRKWWTRVTAPDGCRRRVSLETVHLEEAKRFRAMLEVLSDPRRNSLDLVQRVYDGTLGVRELYARFAENRTEDVRRSGSDPDLSEQVEPWSVWLVSRVRRPIGERQRDDYVRQLRTLIPVGKPFRLSRLSKAAVGAWLVKCGASESTRARYYAALRSFVRYCGREAELFDTDPLFKVDPPVSSPGRDGYMPHGEVLKVLGHLSGEAQAFAALAFGSGMERSALLGLKGQHVVDVGERTIRALGTKTASRNRYVIVDAWAWSYVRPFVEAKRRTAPVFSLDYWAFLDAFYGAQIAAGLVDPLPEGVTVRSAGKRGVSLRGRGFHTLHDCRHTYAVTRLTGEDGEPVRDLQFIADQLGHADLQMVQRVYARHRHRIQRRAEARDQTAVRRAKVR